MTTENETLKQAIQEKYGAAARRAATTQQARCCGDAVSCCGDHITADLYNDVERSALPDTAVSASLGCGNPTALIDLRPGETVLDLGSGGGIDVLLSARRVGPTGKAYGLDMTDDMLALARENQRKAGVENVEFLKGEIEAIPLPDCSVDVIISNCVINLSSDKDRVLREAFRVLKPGGRFAVSDVIRRDFRFQNSDLRFSEATSDSNLNSEISNLKPQTFEMEAWIGCLAGALHESDYRAKLVSAGFEKVDVDTWREYDITGAPGTFASAFIRATKPTPQPCCGTECCK